jgi:photosystem II stability/assembly factor-like uncharacterized protein
LVADVVVDMVVGMILAVAVAAADPFSGLHFRNIGPSVSGGRVTSIVGSNLDPALIYVGAAGGGVFKSTNGGYDWTPLFDRQSVEAIGALAISTTNPEEVWAGTGEANPRNDVALGDGVYKSVDGGKTWLHFGLPQSKIISSIVLDPVHPGTAVVGVLGDPFKDSSDRGIYRTTDGGETWAKTLYVGPQSGASSIVADPKDPSIMYAGIWQFRRSPWSVRSGGPDGGLFKSSDGGATWIKLQGNGLPGAPTGRIDIAIAVSDPKRIYAFIQSKYGLLWRSDDAGVSWRLITNDTLTDERPFYFSHVTVDPANADHLFASSVALAESRDGGRTWKRTAARLHGDHHAMWISSDGKRILEGNDGGAGISLDGGTTWIRQNYIPISQGYRAGFDRRLPYDVCVGLQDDGTWCGPSNSKDPNGILPRDWLKISSGDGTWPWPDPLDPNRIWYSSGGGDNGGDLWMFDKAGLVDTDLGPYLRDQNVLAPALLQYRFNWESPLAFSPRDPHVAYYGGNVLFRSVDRGAHWTAISPDLTRNDTSHQQITGGITLEGTGAETSDTILCIAPSPISSSVIWIATDDGKVQRTDDGGRNWRDVSIQGQDAYSRIETVEASGSDASVAYAVVNRHFAGDYTPYVYVTRDSGRSWRSITSGLPPDQFAHVIREDPVNAAVLYLGLENSLWVSFNRGASWRPLQSDLPHASIRDLRVQPDADDLIVVTHGRGVWILDDLTALQRYAQAGVSADFVFQPRVAYELNTHSSTFGALGAGENPEYGVPISYYQRNVSPAKPAIEIVDSNGRLVRRLSGTNLAGINRVTWNLTYAPPVPWYRAPEWNRGLDDGADVPPGEYAVRFGTGPGMPIRTFAVRSDPAAHVTAAQAQSRHAFVIDLYAMFDGVDRALNALDGRPTTDAPALSLAYEFSCHPANSQDDDFLTDRLRERLQALLGTTSGYGPPSAAQEAEAHALRAEYGRLMEIFKNLR